MTTYSLRPHMTSWSGKPASDVLEHILSNLEPAPAYAEKRGVMRGMENHDFVDTIDYLLHVVKHVKSKWFAVIWDPANLAPTPDLYTVLARIAPYAITAQVKVMKSVNAKDTPADFERLVRILRDAKYRSYIGFEDEERKDPFDAIPRFLPVLRRAMDA